MAWPRSASCSSSSRRCSSGAGHVRHHQLGRRLPLLPRKSGPGGPGLGYRIGKTAGHTLAGSILAEYGGQGIRAFNVDPGVVLTERNSLDQGEFGFDTRWAGPPPAIGAAVAWLVTSPEADELQRGDVGAQQLALDRGLYPDWRPTAD